MVVTSPAVDVVVVWFPCVSSPWVLLGALLPSLVVTVVLVVLPSLVMGIVVEGLALLEVEEPESLASVPLSVVDVVGSIVIGPATMVVVVLGTSTIVVVADAVASTPQKPVPSIEGSEQTPQVS